jgi:fructokinase
MDDQGAAVNGPVAGRTVVGLGEVLWDVYPDGRRLGGAPANAAVHAHRLGAAGAVASAVGNDEAGEAILGNLSGQGIDVSCVQKLAGRPTGAVLVRLDDRGVPSFTCTEDAAFDHMERTPGLEGMAATADAVVVGTLAQRHPDSRKTIRAFLAEAGRALKVVDVNFRGWSDETFGIVRESLELADAVKMNETELDRLRRAFGRSGDHDFQFMDWLIREFRLKLAALSLGPDGCRCTDGKCRVSIPGIPVQAEDTTGCGDAFVAGLVVRTLDGAAVEEAARFANSLGAFVAMRKGAAPEYTPEELEAFIGG